MRTSAAPVQDADRRKRLGQFFSGDHLARTLGALAGVDEAASVIDPMAGTGDMLSLAASGSTVGAIEIDPVPHAKCQETVGKLATEASVVVCGSAFSIETLRRLPTLEWDVVITNPPYVRYQSTSKAGRGDIDIPDAAEVRRNLLATVQWLPTLGQPERKLLGDLARSYSGLADLAVPSWLLCAALVRPGGTLAMVVPNAWLSRDYAGAIHYLLARSFDVEYVVEDGDASWFSNALVRTTLIVARKAGRLRDLGHDGERGHLHLRLTRETADERSLVGSLHPRAADPDAAFAGDARRWRSRRAVPALRGLSGEWVSNRAFASAGQEWLARGSEETPARPNIPRRIAAISSHPLTSVTLEDIGWRVGQGLRTGANGFFYVTHERSSDDAEIVRVSPLLGGQEVTVPRDALLPALRRQSELPEALSIRPGLLRGRVLVLDRYALPEDRASLVAGAYNAMPTELAQHVREAAATNIGTGDDPRFIPELSAVAPNARSGSNSRTPRFWYQLPPLAPRHRPELFMPRVNYGHPRAMLNEDRNAVVDANFSTFWQDGRSSVDTYALLAILNSSWSRAALELTATVLGGGALKVEATQLRRLPLPRCSDRQLAKLSKCGRSLATNGADDVQTLAEIDAVVAEAVAEAGGAHALAAVTRRLAATQLEARSR